MLFKKVDPIFEGEDYLLSRLTSNEEFVCVYDDIIIKGVDTAAFMANSDEVVTEEVPEEEIPQYTDIIAPETVISETSVSGELSDAETSETSSEESEQTLSDNNTEEEISFE